MTDTRAGDCLRITTLKQLSQKSRKPKSLNNSQIFNEETNDESIHNLKKENIHCNRETLVCHEFKGDSFKNETHLTIERAEG